MIGRYRTTGSHSFGIGCLFETGFRDHGMARREASRNGRLPLRDEEKTGQRSATPGVQSTLPLRESSTMFVSLSQLQTFQSRLWFPENTIL